MNLHQFIEKVYKTLGEEPIFMQDNAPVHKAHVVMNWLAGHGNVVMVWPSYSSDLNPIEHIWRELKIALQKQHPNIKHFKGNADTVCKWLTEFFPQEWDTIPQENFGELCCSMSARVEAVIKVKGWYTKN